MERPSETTGWIAVAVAVVVAVGLGAWGAITGAVWPFVAASVVGGAALGGAAGYLAVVGRDRDELHDRLDYRLSLPAAGLFGLAALAVVAGVATDATVAGYEPMVLAGLAFAGAFLLFGVESWTVDGRRGEAVGEAMMAVGWLLAFVPWLDVPFLLAVGPIVLGAAIALVFGPVGEEVGNRVGVGA